MIIVIVAVWYTSYTEWRQCKCQRSFGATIQQRGTMTEQANSTEQIPLGQRLYDSPFLLLAAGLVVMFGFYTIWGLVELAVMPQATLP